LGARQEQRAEKEKRKNPNVLAPGNQIYPPDDETDKTESAPTAQVHQFRLNKDKNLLRLVLEDLYGRPVANATCELTVDGQIFQVVSDGDGKIEQEIASLPRRESLCSHPSTRWWRSILRAGAGGRQDSPTLQKDSVFCGYLLTYLMDGEGRRDVDKAGALLVALLTHHSLPGAAQPVITDWLTSSFSRFWTQRATT
jgi:hypothetical protein